MPSPPFAYRALRSPAPELMLVALVILAYGDTLAFGYVWDDNLLVRLDVQGALARSFQGLHVRPVWYLSYVLSQGLVASATFEHAVSLAMYALAVVLAYRLALAMLERRAAAWVVTLVWTVLPWNAHPVTWIAQRNDLLIFIFGFAAVLAWRRGKDALAWLLLALAMFSKVTVVWVPVFFIWQALRRGHRRTAMAFGALLVGYLGLALKAYVLYLEPAPHLEPLSWSLRLLRFPAHWFEHLVLLAVPVPFFLGLVHALVYLVGALGLLLSSKTAKQDDDNPGRHAAWMLALLASLAAAVTPELRICGFESLFWLLAIAQHRRWPSPLPAAIALVALLAAYGASIAATKTRFDTRSNPDAAVERPNLYPTDYYRLRRVMLMQWVEG